MKNVSASGLLAYYDANSDSEDEYDDYENYDENYDDYPEDEADEILEQDEEVPTTSTQLNLATMLEKKTDTPKKKPQKKKKPAKKVFIQNKEPTDEIVEDDVEEELEFHKRVQFELGIRQCLKMRHTKQHVNHQYNVLHENPQYKIKYEECFNNRYNIPRPTNQAYDHNWWKAAITDDVGAPLPKRITKKAKTKMFRNNYTLLQRHSFASTYHQNIVFIHGGLDYSNNHITSDQLISFDTVSEEITSYGLLDKDSDSPGAMSGHVMVTIANAIYLFSSNFVSKSKRHNSLDIFKIKHPQEPSEVDWSYLGPTGGSMTGDLIIPTRDFSLVSSSNVSKAYMFGGRHTSATSGTDYFYCFEVKQQSTQKVSYNVHKLHRGELDTWPSARYGHASAMINGNVIIYGGKNNNRIFNDLYIHDGKKWTEIDVVGNIPPPVSFHSIVCVNDHFIVSYGGLTANEEPCNMYRFNASSNEWSLLHLMGKESDYAKKLPPVYRHCTVQVGSKLLNIGGNESTSSGTYGNISVITDVLDEGEPAMLPKYLVSKQQCQFMCDLTFHVKDDTEQKGYAEIHAHKSIVAARCPYLAELIAERPGDRIFEIADVESPLLFEQFLRFLYTGELELEGEEVEKFVALAKRWPSPSYTELVENICTTNKPTYLDTHQKMIDKYESDLSVLVNNEMMYTDVQLLLGKDLDMCVSAHKFILARAPYFHRMFASGFKEAEESQVEFDHMDLEAMLKVLTFIYTDRVDVSPATCLGVLIYSSMLGLVELCNFCRNMVKNVLTKENVLQVLDIADLYKDSALKRECMTVIAKAYDEVSKMNEYHDMDPELRSEVDNYYITHNKNKTKRQVTHQSKKK